MKHEKRFIGGNFYRFRKCQIDYIYFEVKWRLRQHFQYQDGEPLLRSVMLYHIKSSLQLMSTLKNDKWELIFDVWSFGKIGDWNGNAPTMLHT